MLCVSVMHAMVFVVAPYNGTTTEAVVNTTVTYTCYADGGPGNMYTWFRQRDNSLVSSMQKLILDNTNPLDGGEYQCIVNNDAGYFTAMTTLNGNYIDLIYGA